MTSTTGQDRVEKAARAMCRQRIAEDRQIDPDAPWLARDEEVAVEMGWREFYGIAKAGLAAADSLSMGEGKEQGAHSVTGSREPNPSVSALTGVDPSRRTWATVPCEPTQEMQVVGGFEIEEGVFNNSGPNDTVFDCAGRVYRRMLAQAIEARQGQDACGLVEDESAVNEAIGEVDALKSRLLTSEASLSRMREALTEIAQQDRGGIQGLMEDGASDDEITKHALFQVERRRNIARSALSQTNGGDA